MQNIEQVYARRDLGVMLFRAGLLALAGAGLATLYLLVGVGQVSAAYGGVCLTATTALLLIGAVALYAPAQRNLRANGIQGGTILQHLSAPTSPRSNAERDILDQLERDLDF